MHKQYYFIFLIIILGKLSAIGQDRPLAESDSFESDFKSLEEHIQKNIVYPEDARIKRIYGIVYIQFKIDSSGTITKKAIKTLFGLSPSCNREAERVVGSYNKKWRTAHHELADRLFVIPIQFLLTDDEAFDFPSHILDAPTRTVVLPKGIKTKDSTWSVYGEKGFNSSVGKISPGDTVTVTGWAAWCYFIQTKNIAGYISHRALRINSQMDAVAKIIEEQSAVEDEMEKKMQEEKLRQRPLDTVRNFSIGTAHLSLSTSKKSIFVGECTTLTLAFNVREDNQLKLQFHDLEAQLSKILATSLNLDAFIVNNNISNIEGEEFIISNRKYTTYKIYQAAFCPNREQPFRIPTIKLKMLLGKRKDKEIEKIVEFNSTPVTVNVKPLPPTGLTTYNRYKMVGNFTLEEKVSEKSVHLGTPFTYQMRIKGEGLIFPIEPLALHDPDMDIRLHNIEDNDTIIHDVLHSDKTFTYQMIPRNEGSYDFGKIISFSFFDPIKNKKEILQSSLKIIAKNADKPGQALMENKNNKSRNNFIAIDASQSMMIEDHLPNRLSVVKEGIKKFLNNKTDCDIGIISFAGDARHINPDQNNSCYSTTCLDSITFLAKSGTAIGEAIWLARVSMSTEKRPKKIVVIGDGDNTAGVISPRYASELAKSNGIHIYTIGIGNKGRVPFGRDAYGRPCMFENTFSDLDLKRISQLTGGQYYYASNAEEINKILNQIFSK